MYLVLLRVVAAAGLKAHRDESLRQTHYPGMSIHIGAGKQNGDAARRRRSPQNMIDAGDFPSSSQKQLLDVLGEVRGLAITKPARHGDRSSTELPQEVLQVP